MMTLRKLLFLSMLLASVVCVLPSHATGQDACCFQPAYRLQCETVMEPQTVERLRVSYETEYVEEEVTSYRPVLKTRTEQREYKVTRPVIETSYREERFTVWKPVVETSMREETVNQTSYVTETAEREERVTTYKPVTETSYQQRQYTVQRPVTQTSYYDQQYTVQRPVVETKLQTQQYTTMRPVTTVQNQTVDAGGYVAQQTVTPGQLQYGLQYVPNAYATPGPFGLFARVRGTYAVTPQMTAPTVQTQYSYRPNYINQQIASTSYVPQTQQVQVPVQVQRMQTEVRTQRVPVQTQRMQTETVTQNVPVQTTRMVATTEVRKVPYVVTKPVTQTLTRKVPVEQRRWVKEEKVRQVPVQSTRLVVETVSKPVEVSYYEQEAVVQKVRKPVTKQVYVPYTETVMVPRQVVQKYAPSYYDPFSSAIVSGYSSFSDVQPGSVISDTVTSSRPVIEPEVYGDSVIDDESDVAPQTRMEKVETEFTGPANGNVDADDATELPSPSLNGADSEYEGESGTEATEAGYRIRWMPQFAREA